MQDTSLSSIPSLLIDAIDKNNVSHFKTILTNKIQPSIISYILQLCFSSYQSGNCNALTFIDILLQNGADPNINIYPSSSNKELFKTPLMFAVEQSNITLTQLLLQYKINTNFRDTHGKTALFYLKGKKNDEQIIKMLLSEGIDVNIQSDKDGNTALHSAIIQSENNETIINLLQMIDGVDYLDIKNNNGKNILELLYERWSNENQNDYLTKALDIIKNKMLFYNNNNSNNDNNKDDVTLHTNSDDSMLKEISIDNVEYDTYLSTTSTNSSSILINTSNKLYTNSLNKTKKDTNNEQCSAEDQITLIKKSNEYLTKYHLTLQELKLKKATLNKSKQSEISRLQKKLNQKQTILKHLTDTLNSNTSSHKEQITTLEILFKEKLKALESLKEQLDQLSQSNKDNIIHSNTMLHLMYMPHSIINKKFNLNNETYNITYITKQLHIDLIDFNKHISIQVNKMQPIYDKITSLIETYVKECLGNDYSIKVYGSHATHLCLPWSDIDIVVTMPSFTNYTPLFALYQFIQSKNIYKQINYIGKTQVPLIKMIMSDTYSNISLDISLEDTNHYGVHCVDFVNAKRNQYAVLTPLTLAIKNILQKANLNDPYKGGLSSYGVILLILYFLKQQETIGKEVNIDSLGVLFYDFLYYYGFTFEPNKAMIDIDGYISNNNNNNSIITPFHMQMMNGELVIVDPLNNHNNVGKNTRQFNMIKLAFTIAYICAKECCECGCHYQYGEYYKGEEMVEHCLLKRIFNSVKRFDQEEFGK